MIYSGGGKNPGECPCDHGWLIPDWTLTSRGVVVNELDDVVLIGSGPVCPVMSLSIFITSVGHVTTILWPDWSLFIEYTVCWILYTWDNLKIPCRCCYCFPSSVPLIQPHSISIWQGHREDCISKDTTNWTQNKSKCNCNVNPHYLPFPWRINVAERDR